MNTRILNTNEVAEILNISRTHAFNMMRHGIIPSFRIGNCIRVEEKDLLRFIAASKTAINLELLVDDNPINHQEVR